MDKKLGWNMRFFEAAFSRNIVSHDRELPLQAEAACLSNYSLI